MHDVKGKFVDTTLFEMITYRNLFSSEWTCELELIGDCGFDWNEKHVEIKLHQLRSNEKNSTTKPRELKKLWSALITCGVASFQSKWHPPKSKY